MSQPRPAQRYVPLVHHWNVTLTASVKLFVFPMSLYQHWKLYVSPGTTATSPAGWGTAVRSIWMLPVGPTMMFCDWL